MIKTGQAWAGTFVTLDATGALATPSSGPAGVLYVDGTANAATVTITGSNPYKWAVTLPTLTAGQRVDMYITATIDTIATAGIVASEQADTILVSDVVGADSDTLDTIDKKVSAFIDPTGYQVTGTGQEELDGIFRRVDDYVYHNQAGYFLERDSGAWRIYSPAPEGFPDTVFYTATSDAETPDLVDNWELGQHGELPLPEIGFVSAVRLAGEQGRTTWKQVKIVDDVEEKGALVIQNNGENGAGISTFGKFAGMVNYGDEYGQLNMSEEGSTPVSGYDPAIVTAIEALVNAIKGEGWTDETLVTLKAYVDEIETRLTATRAGYLDKLNVTGTLAHSDAAAAYKADVSGLAPANEYDAQLSAIQADLDNPDQYKADVSGLATSAALDAVDAKVSAIDTDTVMSFMIDGFTFEQIVQIMASVLAGKLTRSGDTLTFRDLADTVNRVVAETDANKQRTDMTYTV